MRTIDLSDEVYAAVQKLATGFNQSPDAALASLLNVPHALHEASNPLAAFVLSPDFRSKFTDADKYLALLAWVAAKHPDEIRDFIDSQTGGRRFISHSREEIIESCRHNQARQITGTRYWAIMNIDTATKRRLLARVLDFTGHREEIIEFVCNAIGMRRVIRRSRLASLVA